jgi:hypothetical protein
MVELCPQTTTDGANATRSEAGCGLDSVGLNYSLERPPGLHGGRPNAEAPKGTFSMAEIRTVTTHRRKREEIRRTIIAYEEKLSQAKADLAHVSAAITSRHVWVWASMSAGLL